LGNWFDAYTAATVACDEDNHCKDYVESKFYDGGSLAFFAPHDFCEEIANKFSDEEWVQPKALLELEGDDDPYEDEHLTEAYELALNRRAGSSWDWPWVSWWSARRRAVTHQAQPVTQAFNVGDQVIWKGENTELPRGTVGVVTQLPNARNQIEVKFFSEQVSVVRGRRDHVGIEGGGVREALQHSTGQ